MTESCRTYEFDREVEEAKRALNLVWFLLQEIYIISGVVLFFWRRRSSMYLQKAWRTSDIVSIGIGTAYIPISVSLPEFVGPGKFPCMWKNFNFIAVLGFLVIVSALRTFLHYYRLLYQRALAEESYFSMLTTDNDGQMVYYQEYKSVLNLLWQKSATNDRKKSVNLDMAGRISAVDISNDESNGSDEHTSINRKPVSSFKLARLKLFASEKFHVFLYHLHFIIVIICFGIPYEKPVYELSCCFEKGSISAEFWIFLGIYSLVFSTVTYFAVKRMKMEKYDPFGIEREFNLASLSSLMMGVGLVFHFLDVFGILLSPNFRWLHIVEVSVLFWFTLWVPMQIYISYSKERTDQHQDRRSHSQVSEFEIFLNTDTASRNHFIVYLTSELSLENFYFYKEATDWKKSYNEEEENVRNAKALDIFSVFIKPNSVLEINIKSDTRVELIEVFNALMETGEANFEDTLFDRALKEVTHLMASGPYLRYLRTEGARKVSGESFDI